MASSFRATGSLSDHASLDRVLLRTGTSMAVPLRQEMVMTQLRLVAPISLHPVRSCSRASRHMLHNTSRRQMARRCPLILLLLQDQDLIRTSRPRPPCFRCVTSPRSEAWTKVSCAIWSWPTYSLVSL